MPTLPLHSEALVLEADGEFKLLPVIIDNIRPDEILVEMKFSGICHTVVLSMLNRNFTQPAEVNPNLELPAALGHEGAGIIQATGSEVVNPTLKVGVPVICSFNYCTNCRNCKTGRPAYCNNFESLNIGARRLADGSTPAKLLDGRRLTSQFFGQSSFIKHAVVSQASVVPCPFPEDIALYAPLGCGFQTGAGTVFNALKPSCEDSLLVFGTGTVGLASIMAANYLDLRQTIAVDLVPSKLQLAKELGATHTMDARKTQDVVAEVKRLTGGDGARFAIDCAGVTTVIESLSDYLCNGGTAVIVGAPPPDYVLQMPLSDFLHASKTIRGICQGDCVPQDFVPYMMKLRREGHLPLEKLCTYYGVQNFQQAFLDLREGKVLKPVLVWDSSSLTRLERL